MKPNNEAHALMETLRREAGVKQGPIHADEMKTPDDGLWMQMKTLCVWIY